MNKKILVGLTLMLIAFIVGVLVLLTSDSQDKTQTLNFTLEGIKDDDVGLVLYPPIIELFDVEKGETITEIVRLKYYEEFESADINVKLMDFDINKEDCTDRTPKLDKKSDNYGGDWVNLSLLDYDEVYESKQAKIQVEIAVPEDVEEKTYWFALTFVKDNPGSELDSALSNLFFFTVGDDEASEKCLRD